MKKIEKQRFWVNVAMAAIYFIVGLLCIIIPKQLTTAIPYVLGAALIINGGLRIAGYFLNKKGLAFGLTTYGLAEGVLDILLAIIIFINASISLVIVAVLIGIWAIISGIINITKAINNQESNKQKIINYIFAAAQIILGALLFFNYKGGITVSVVISGIYLIFLALNIVLTKIVAESEFAEIKQNAEEAFSPATTRLAFEPSVPSMLKEQPPQASKPKTQTNKASTNQTAKPQSAATKKGSTTKKQTNTKPTTSTKNTNSANTKKPTTQKNQNKKTTN